MFEYQGINRKVYEGGAMFIPVCKKCGRFVKADDEIKVNNLGNLSKDPNATCSKCGRVQMIFDGWY